MSSLPLNTRLASDDFTLEPSPRARHGPMKLVQSTAIKSNRQFRVAPLICQHQSINERRARTKGAAPVRSDPLLIAWVSSQTAAAGRDLLLPAADPPNGIARPQN